jgi:hypothetical protein
MRMMVSKGNLQLNVDYRAWLEPGVLHVPGFILVKGKEGFNL